LDQEAQIRSRKDKAKPTHRAQEGHETRRKLTVREIRTSIKESSEAHQEQEGYRMTRPDDEDAVGSIQGLMNADKWPEAAAKAEEFLVNAPSNHEVLWQAGWSRFQMGDYARAESHLRRAVDAGAEGYEHYMALGAALTELERYGEAELWLARSLVLRDALATRLCLALVYHKQGLLRLAEGVHKEGLRLAPQDLARMEAYADFLSDVGRAGEAETLYAEAKKRAPS
jgi:tetratricopeptide (TPR) repeat protein